MRVTEEHPGQTQEPQIRADVFARDPYRRCHERDAEARPLTDPVDGESPQADVRGQIGGQEQLIEDVIGGHGPDPVEQSGKERDASNEGQAARARYRLSVECDQQWRQRHPRQVAQVELGNAQDEQYRAERGETEIDRSTAGHQRQYCLF